MEKNSVVVVCDSYYLSAKSGESSSRSPSPNRSLKGFNLFRVISQKIGRGIRQSKEYKSTSSDDDGDEEEEEEYSSISKNNMGNGKKNSECDCDYYYKNQRRVVIIDNNNYGRDVVVKNKKMAEKELQDYKISNKKCLKFTTSNRHHHSSGSDTYSSNDDSSESNETDQQKTRRSHSSSNESYASSSSSSAESYKPSDSNVRKGLKNLNINSKSLSCFNISQAKDSSERRESIAKDKRCKKSPQKILRQPATHTYVRGISGLPTLKVINTRGCYNNQYSRG